MPNSSQCPFFSPLQFLVLSLRHEKGARRSVGLVLWASLIERRLERGPHTEMEICGEFAKHERKYLPGSYFISQYFQSAQNSFNFVVCGKTQKTVYFSLANVTLGILHSCQWSERTTREKEGERVKETTAAERPFPLSLPAGGGGKGVQKVGLPYLESLFGTHRESINQGVTRAES